MSKSDKAPQATDYLIVFSIWIPALIGLPLLVRAFFQRSPVDSAHRYFLPTLCAVVVFILAGMLLDLRRRRRRSRAAATDPEMKQTGSEVAERVREAQREMLLDIVKAELVFGAIYGKFAALYPNSKAFWDKLTEEEYSHASVLSGLEKQLDQGSVFWNLGQFHTRATKEHVALAEKTSERANDPDLPEEEAFRLAVEMETSLIDSRFYSVVESDATEFKYVAQAMLNAEKAHVRRLCEYMSSYGSSCNAQEGDA